METKSLSDLVHLYCIKHHLEYHDHAQLVVRFGGKEEWEGIKSAGLDHMGTAFIVEKDNGVVEVVTAYADGFKRMEDRWTSVCRLDLESGRQLHADE